MQKDRTTGAISYMEPEEIEVYRLYDAAQIQRDDLPYTGQFDRIVTDFNSTLGKSDSHHDVWKLLLKVLKQGEANVRKFLNL